MNHVEIFPDSEDSSVPVEMVRLDSAGLQVLVLLAVFTAEILLTQVLGLDIWTSSAEVGHFPLGDGHAR